MLEDGVFVCGNPECREQVTNSRQNVYKDPTCKQAFDCIFCYNEAMRDRDIRPRPKPEIMTLEKYQQECGVRPNVMLRAKSRR